MRTTFNPEVEGLGRSHWMTLATLMPYLWPRGRWDLRFRVVLAMLLLAAAKIAIVFIPFIYKEVIDALNMTGPGDKAGMLERLRAADRSIPAGCVSHTDAIVFTDVKLDTN